MRLLLKVVESQVFCIVSDREKVFSAFRGDNCGNQFVKHNSLTYERGGVLARSYLAVLCFLPRRGVRTQARTGEYCENLVTTRVKNEAKDRMCGRDNLCAL